MKVIAQGDIWTSVISCEDCHTKMEVDDKDVRCYQYEGTSQVDYYVRCPHCTVEVRVDPPTWVRNKVKSR